MGRRSALKIQEGGGFSDVIFDGLSKVGLVKAEYPGEKHMPGYHFLGPGTNLDARKRDAAKGAYTPINKVDAAAKVHDLSYKKSNQKIKNKEIDQQEFMNEIHKSDEIFINSLKQIPGLNLTKLIAEKSMIIKKVAEKLNLLSPTEFSQSGGGKFNDIMSDLGIPPDNVLRKQKQQRGGFLPAALIPWIAPIVSGLAAEGINKIYEHFKNKGQKGSGILTIDNKRKMVAKQLDQLAPNEQINILYNVLTSKKD